MSLRFVARRAASLVPVLIGVTVLVFLLIHLTPGDPARVMLGADYTPAGAAQLRSQLGLDRPLYQQYAVWLGHLLEGNLGASLFSHEPVLSLVLQRVPTTLLLAFGGMAFGLVVGMPMGVVAAVHPSSMWDQATRILSVLGVAMPVYWLGLVLIEYLAVDSHVFPPGGSVSEYGLQAMVLPWIAVGTPFGGVVARTSRSALLECMSEGYIDTARAKGLRQRRILWVHAIRNSLIPIVTIVGLQFGVLLGGAVITESIFALPGVGRLLLESISERDFPVLQGCVLVIALGFVLVNFVTDLLYSAIDPRVRLS